MSAHAHQPLGGRLFTLPFIVCLVLVAIAAVFVYERFAYGLGAVTNINDGYPWGIWVAVDIVIGTAFGCAGYVMAFLVYIINKGEYHPLVRPAVMASLFGYGLAGIAVLVDLGRYWNFWHLVSPTYANFSSVMVEVGMCVAAYTTVLMIEFSPAFLEKFGMRDLRAKLNKVMWVFIALGVLLPTMHQSSLGTMMVVVGNKLSPIWQTQFLPLFFLLTAILMGFAIVVWEGVLSTASFGRPSENHMLKKIAGIMMMVGVAFLAFRFIDLIGRGALGTALTGPMSGWFWLETLLMIGGVGLLIPQANRSLSRALFISSSLMLLAGIFYRLNVYLIGYTPAIGPWSYFPAFKEIMITVGIFALEIVLYLIFVKTLPVMHASHAHQAAPAE
jgi:Ni/Fe-hydrogenase subunit HybB-like protein